MLMNWTVRPASRAMLLQGTKSRASVTASCLLLASLAGCGNYPLQTTVYRMPKTDTPALQPSVASTPVTPAVSQTVQTTRSMRSYLLQPSDNFDVKFFLTPELNENVVIGPDGRIALQLVGEVQAAGQTVPELEAALRQAYAKELRNPLISVIVKSYSPQRVFVAGEVRNPGELVIQGELTALQAIARAGFFTPDAQTQSVVILRYKGEGGPEFITLNAQALLQRPGAPDTAPLHAAEDVVLQPMDVVYVAQTRIAGVADFFSRYVNNIVPLWRNLGFSAVYYTNTAKVRSVGQPTVNAP